MKRLAAPILIVLQLTLVGLAAGVREQADRQVVINGVRLTAAELHYLHGASGVVIPDAHYLGYPVPEIFVHETTTPQGETRHAVVDGQQAIRTVLQFLGLTTLGPDVLPQGSWTVV